MDPGHASIAGRLFFSRAEKNQKAKGRKLRSFRRPKRTKRPRGAEKSFTARTAALRLSGRTRCAQTLPLRDAAAMQPLSPAFLRAPAIRTRLKEIREVRDFKDLKDSKAPKDGATEFPDGGGATGCAIDR